VSEREREKERERERERERKSVRECVRFDMRVCAFVCERERVLCSLCVLCVHECV